MRKPAGRVLGIDGRQPDRDVVSQSKLQELEKMQRLEWIANKRASLLSEEIKTAVRHGAAVEPGPLYWDNELEMARTKKTG